MCHCYDEETLSGGLAQEALPQPVGGERQVGLTLWRGRGRGGGCSRQAAKLGPLGAGRRRPPRRGAHGEKLGVFPRDREPNWVSLPLPLGKGKFAPFPILRRPPSPHYATASVHKATMHVRVCEAKVVGYFSHSHPLMGYRGRAPRCRMWPAASFCLKSCLGCRHMHWGARIK